jgi:hypothetical protein
MPAPVNGTTVFSPSVVEQEFDNAATETPTTGDLVLWQDADGTVKKVAITDFPGTGGGALEDGDYGDITVGGSGTTMTIDEQVVTPAKMSIATTDRLIGRDTTGGGAAELINLTGGLGFTGSGGIQIATGGVTSAKLGASAVQTAAIGNNQVTLAKLATINTAKLLGNNAGTVEVPSEIALGAGGSLAFSGSTVLRAALTGDVTASADSNATTIASDAVTNAKAANMATQTVKGRNTAGTGDPEDLSMVTLVAMLGVDGTLLSVLQSIFWNTVNKASDTARTSTTTYADDPDLAVAMEANTTYMFDGLLLFDNGAGSSGYKWQFNGPASPTFLRLARYWVPLSGTAFAGVGVDTAYAISHTTSSTGGTNGGAVWFSGMINNGANAGDFVVQWAQEASTGNQLVLRRGSRIRYRVVV